MVDLYNMDCMEAMKEMEDNQFDLAIVDPPYFAGPNKSGYYGKGYSNLGIKRSKHYNDIKSWQLPNEKYFKLLKRVSKNQIIWGANHFADKFNSSGSCWLVWDKENGSSSFADCELAYTSFSTAVRVFRYVWNGMHQGSYGGDMRKNETRIHPTQKPTSLYKWILQNYASTGDKILDTHLGSGSNAIACYDMGFDLTAFEIDESSFLAARNWLQNHQGQGDLFTGVNLTEKQQELKI